MKLYLTPELHAQRRGRFLANLLGISQPFEQGLPQTGFVLMTGEQLQESSSLQDEYAAWALQPGCSLLLLPPYKQGSIFHFLDWIIELTPSAPVITEAPSLMSILENEISYRLCGIDGACIDDVNSGELVNHTRYWKSYANSGLIAATTLPLWSISLLDRATMVHDFLVKIDRHCGLQATISEVEEDQPKADAMYPQDVTVLVCCYGFGIASIENLLSRLNAYAVPLVNFDHLDVSQSHRRLKNAGLIDDSGVTEQGVTHLMESKYWLFAEKLREEA